MSMSPAAILARYRTARERRRPWEGVWQECYDHVLPRTPGLGGPTLYDGTAADAAEQLAASLVSQLTPPWSRWFALASARGLAGSAEEAEVAPLLEDAAEALQAHLDQSNFAVEMHQAFLDLVVAGTAVLAVEEQPPGTDAAFRFTAVPLQEAVLEQGPSGRLDTVFRTAALTVAEIRERFPGATLPRNVGKDDAARLPVIEATWPERDGHRFAAILIAEESAPVTLAQGRFAQSPFIAFRWLKAPGETYGRGPVMKALPDIRTAQKVVELVLKNASIAVTGIWQADDDGVLNPANVRLVPGAIIPKAVGSQGLTPLAPPGRFDVSQLVLDDLRKRIRNALLADRLAPPADARMTATEVLERSVETARLLGATYGRLQTELLTPLVGRCLAILCRRGEIPDLILDGSRIALRYRSPLAQVEARAAAQPALLWLQAVAALGPDAAALIDAPATARYLARTLGAPSELLGHVQPDAARPG